MHLLPLWLDKTWNRILLAFSILTGDKRESHGWNESKFRAIFDFANDGIQIIHDGVIVDCNDKMASLFGVGRQDIIGKTPACLSPAYQLNGQKSIDLARQMLASTEKGQATIFEWKHIRGGQEFDTEISLSCFAAGGETYVLAIIRDISQRKQAERELHIAHELLAANYEEMNASNEELTALYEQLAASEQALQLSYNELDISRKELKESLDRYRLAMEGANDILFDWDIISDRVTWSGRWTEMLGLTFAEIDNVMERWHEWIHPNDRERRHKALDDHISGKTPFYSVEYRVRTKSGAYMWVLSRAKAMFDEEGQVIRIAGSFTDIAERKAKDEEIWQLVYRDPLTGLANRRQLFESLESELVLARQGQSAGAILFFDLDNFKVVNDACGHGQGDKLLIEIANILNGVVGATDLVARLGGDEFIILLPGVSDLPAISRYADSLVAVLSRQFNFCGHTFDITASVGIVRYPLDGDEVEELIKNADTALYVVKNAGKDNWCLFQPTMQQDLLKKIAAERDLREALDKNEFILYFQPVVKAATGKISGFEALIRWKKDGVIIPPSDFIPLAEQTGLIVPLGKWVLESACAFAQILKESGYGDRFVAVNVSVQQLDADEFVHIVQQVLDQVAIDPSCLELEITESMLMESKSFTANAAKLKILRDQGVRIALDDFGTGYSSLTYLRQLPIDVVKLDRSFMDGAGENKNAMSFISSLIRLTHSLGLLVVAEGIEEKHQYDALVEENCDFLQGYLISRPVPADEAIKLLRK